MKTWHTVAARLAAALLLVVLLLVGPFGPDDPLAACRAAVVGLHRLFVL